MDVFTAIYTRRSIRKYKPDTISEEALKQILMAGMQAPSSGNGQPWHFVVIDDVATLQRLGQIHPNAPMVAEAPMAILVCGEQQIDRYKPYLAQDLSAATQNILLAAHAKGLGAVWVSIYPTLDRCDTVRRMLKIPAAVTPFSLIPLGYPDEEKPSENRFNPKRVRKNNWS